MSASKNTVANDPFELKGSLFTLTVLHLNNADITQIDGHLGAKVSQAPGFFQNVPVVIDLENLSDQGNVDFSALYSTLRKHGLVPVAVRNGSDALHQAALDAGLPGLSAARSASPAAAGSEPQKNTVAAALDAPAVARNKTVTDTAATKKNIVPGRIHTHPVRSGQQIYAQGGDLIVLGAVSAGAEVLADGSVHIYGPLRGRALAGVQGDNKARIFCQSFEAQLVSVAGQYRLIEQIDETMTGQFTQIYLQQDRLIIEPLTR